MTQPESRTVECPTIEQRLAAALQDNDELNIVGPQRAQRLAIALIAAAKEHGLVIGEGELDVERLRAAIISSSALFHGNPNPDREQALATTAAKDIAREYERFRR